MLCEVLSKDGKKVKISFTPGQTVGELVNKVAGKFQYPPSSVRLFFCGRELKPLSESLDKFEIGKFGNFLLHLSTTTIEIIEPTNSSSSSPPLPLPAPPAAAPRSLQIPLPSASSTSSITTTSATTTATTTTPSTSTSTSQMMDLTTASVIPLNDHDRIVDLTTTSPQIRERKKRRILSSQAPLDAPELLRKVSEKQLRINISRALNHRLCILENRISNPQQSSNLDAISVEFLVKDSGVVASYLVCVGREVSCQCENSMSCPCPHILFILMKIFKVPPDHPSLSHYPVTFSAESFREMLTTRGYIIPQESGVVYCGTHTAAQPLTSITSTPKPDTEKPVVVVPSLIPQEPECSVCLRTLIIPPESFETGDELVACKNCHNKLHRYCLQQWLERSETCPNCRFIWKKSSLKKSPVGSKSARLVR